MDPLHIQLCGIHRWFHGEL